MYDLYDVVVVIMLTKEDPVNASTSTQTIKIWHKLRLSRHYKADCQSVFSEKHYRKPLGDAALYPHLISLVFNLAVSVIAGVLIISYQVRSCSSSAALTD